jgi:geranylgeranyl pyrophosphate synthase
MKLKGKRLRGYLVEQWYAAHAPPDKNSRELAVIIEAVHAATLHIDDVQDRSSMRRGQPAFHVVHGEPLAINTGLLLLFSSSVAARALPHGDVIATQLTTQLTELVLGQGYDVLWEHEHRIHATMAEYRMMAGRKTGALFALCAKAADTLAGVDHDDAIDCVLEQMGIVFQLSDDVLNVTPGDTLGKEFAEDVREQKITSVYLCAHASANAQDKQRLEKLYREEKLDAEHVTEVLSLFERTRAIAQVREECQSIIRECRAYIDNNVTQPVHQNILHAFLKLLDRV